VEATISATVSIDEAGATLEQWSREPQRFTKILVEMDA
jgi:hypothetical protein